ncbi:MAG: aminotransferase class V-fold PLP-dependent enzyme [Flavobacteriales bacterium]|nr:MAG: aminotransferase class V-fold PLP-dependent enzyme [Flavobacteriales bacterium]
MPVPCTLPDHDTLRAAYPAFTELSYLDTSSMGLMAASTVAAAQREHERLMREGSVRFFHWMYGGNTEVARTVAASVGGTEQGTALVQSFTVGLAQLAPLLKHRPKVLLVGHDYPTLHAPFALPGFQRVVMQPEADGTISLDTLRAALERERPQLVAISEVQWLTGFRIELTAVAELCRAFGAWSLVDITQSWCAVPLDVQAVGIDLVGASGYKWPLAGFGNGFMHLSEAVRAELQERNGVDPIAMLNAGHRDPVAVTRLQDALARITAIGPEQIVAHVSALCTYALDRFDAAGITVLHGRQPEQRAGILVLQGDEARVKRLEEQRVKVAYRGKGIRVGIHFYNNVQDIDRLVEVWGK